MNIHPSEIPSSHEAQDVELHALKQAREIDPKKIAQAIDHMSHVGFANEFAKYMQWHTEKWSELFESGKLVIQIDPYPPVTIYANGIIEKQGAQYQCNLNNQPVQISPSSAAGRARFTFLNGDLAGSSCIEDFGTAIIKDQGPILAGGKFISLVPIT